MQKNPRSWTVANKWPIAVVSALLALVCAWSLFGGAPFTWWIGAVGLTLLVLWVVIYGALYRRGY